MFADACNDGADYNDYQHFVKNEVFSSHLQVVQVLDSFDVSNKQVRMNFNGSGRLCRLSLILFEIQIPYYP